MIIAIIINIKIIYDHDHCQWYPPPLPPHYYYYRYSCCCSYYHHQYCHYQHEHHHHHHHDDHCYPCCCLCNKSLMTALKTNKATQKEISQKGCCRWRQIRLKWQTKEQWLTTISPSQQTDLYMFVHPRSAGSRWSSYTGSRAAPTLQYTPDHSLLLHTSPCLQNTIIHICMEWWLKGNSRGREGVLTRTHERGYTTQTYMRTHKYTCGLFVGWLHNVPATCYCVSETDLVRQFYVLPHWDRVADQTFYLTQSQYTDTGPTSPSDDPITPGAWQGSHWSAKFSVTGTTRLRKNHGASGIWTRDLPLVRRTPNH